jgi:hypothetical protein
MAEAIGNLIPTAKQARDLSNHLHITHQLFIACAMP